MLVLMLGLAAAAASPAFAARHVSRPHAAPLHAALPVTGATDPAKDAALVVDGQSGKVLYARNATEARHPASLTKMMTLYLLFDALKRRVMTMQTAMPVSAHAAAQKPTKLYLRKGQSIDVDTAIRAIVVRSANDVAVVIAEALGGTESHFAEMMTQKARDMGMQDTNFHNASGLPDPLQITTASDLAILARHLAYDFPQYFPYFATPGFTYKGTYYATHDNLIGRYDGADGIKTGYTGASGFNLVSSVVRGGVHVIAVVMGGRTAYRRDVAMVQMLDDAFARINADPVLVARGPVPWHDMAQEIPALAAASPAAGAAPLRLAGLAPMSALANPGGANPEDEDAAEARREPGEDFTVIHAETAALAPPAAKSAPTKPAPAQSTPVLALAAQPVPAIRPLPRPQPPEDKIALALPVLPMARPELRAQAGEGDIGDAGVPAGPRNWTIQIGAYADKGLADTQLASYAQKSLDVLGQAGRIVMPFQSVDGHTLYRARFGLFAEREAREVCDRLTRRGQTCFAAVQTR